MNRTLEPYAARTLVFPDRAMIDRYGYVVWVEFDRAEPRRAR